MSRKITTADGSLDLLLDTICNTFGGVLFISLLLVVLVNISSRRLGGEPPEAAARIELAEWKERLVQTQEELESLRALGRQQELLGNKILDPRLEELATELDASLRARDQLLAARNEELKSIAESQADANRVAVKLRDLQTAVREAGKALEQIDAALKAEVKARSRTTELPTPRRTRKVEIAFLLQRGRLTCCAARNPDGSPAECVEKTDARGTYVEPRANAGIEVDLGDRSGGALASRLREFDPRWHYIAVAVSPDSFPHFAPVRNAMTGAGFEYRLIPLRQAERVYVSASPGDVKVQ